MPYLLAKKKNKGFTLIELLVVISIIGLLSSIVLASVNTARAKARDAKRAADMVQIMNALNLFYDKYGCLPTTSNSTCAPSLSPAYNDTNCGTWDYSSQLGTYSGAGGNCISQTGSSFMSFLETSGFMSKVPVDPINNKTNDSTDNNGGYAYKYYCYSAGPTGNYGGGLHVGYISERTGQEVIKNNTNNTLDYNNNVANQPWTDTTYLCK